MDFDESMTSEPYEDSIEQSRVAKGHGPPGNSFWTPSAKLELGVSKAKERGLVEDLCNTLRTNLHDIIEGDS